MQRLMDSINQTLQHKLLSLESFLNQITNGFYSIAEEIDNTNLKTAMIAVAIECKQYAQEICNQLHEYNISIPTACNNQIWEKIEENISTHTSLARGDEIATLCNNCEMYFSVLYQAVLKEHFPYKNLKDIISYQLYAIQCAFMKIRLLNTLRFNQ